MLFEHSVTGVGFEPTPPERLELESSALDHSAIQPTSRVRAALAGQAERAELHAPRATSPCPPGRRVAPETAPGTTRLAGLPWHPDGDAPATHDRRVRRPPTHLPSTDRTTTPVSYTHLTLPTICSV